MRLIHERNRKKEEGEFAAWCDELAVLPNDFEWTLKDGLQADVELQPTRWIGLGLNIIESSKVIARVQLSHGIEGPPLKSILPYPVFQMGAEIFLKGMWLCQFDECRELTWRSYIDTGTRKDYSYRLGGPGENRGKRSGSDRLGHDLLKIVAILRQVPGYKTDAATWRFFKLVESIVRRDYFPFYKADKGKSRWAAARYPKRFYDDINRLARADAYLHYPPADYIAKVFGQMKSHLHDLWNLSG